MSFGRLKIANDASSPQIDLCRVVQKEVYSCDYAKHSLFLYSYVLIIVLVFHTSNYKPTFAQPCRFKATH